MKSSLCILVLVILGACGSCPPGTAAIDGSVAAIVADNEAYLSADVTKTEGEKVAMRLRNREAAALASKLAAECSK